MNKLVGAGIVALLMIAGIVAGVVQSNLVLSQGRATFAPGSNGLNTLRLRGPSGWHCIEYSKTTGMSGGLELAGKGRSECPLFGEVEMRSTDYPATGETVIPLEQPTLVYQNAAKTYEIYVLLTRDPAAYDRLATP
jgi:hypothetical protein